MLLVARIASTVFLLSYVVAVAAGEDELEIHGSLSGYNLLLPEARCCALSIHLMPNGELTTVVLYDWPDSWDKAPYLSRSELDRTRRACSVWRIIRNPVKDPKALVP
jgi:hypothetical protein